MLVCFTGKMRMTRDRETEKFEEMGIHVKNSITKATDVLVTGYDVGQTKIDKANKYGIKILSESKFFEWLKENYPEYYL